MGSSYGVAQSKDKGLQDVMDNIDKAQQIAHLRGKSSGQTKLIRSSFFETRPILKGSSLSMQEGRLLITLVEALDISRHIVLLPVLRDLQQDQEDRIQNNQGQQVTIDYTRVQRKKVVGSLNQSSSVEYWEKIKSSPLILNWLKNGIPLFPRGERTHTAQIERFNVRWHFPNAEAVDCFT